MTEALVSPAARADLIAQCQFFAEEVGDPALANRFAASAERTFKTLARTPGLGRVRSFTDRRAANLRSWRVDDFPNYLVLGAS
jgi:plasmid stabilization system protein ParE